VLLIAVVVLLVTGCSSRIEEMRDVPTIAKKSPARSVQSTTVVPKIPMHHHSEKKQLSEIADALQGSGGHYKIGRPYKINGTWYFPREDWSYDEVGNGSWYGADFHGKRTANGEIFDMDKISAAHRTLPLPCVVRVTNMENGFSAIVRVNDRGPFANGRIIDLSRAAARLLRFHKYGSATVRVQILPEESKAIKEKLLKNKKRPSSPDGKEEASNNAYKEKIKNFFQKLVAPDAEESAKEAEGSLEIQVASFAEEEDAHRLVFKIQKSMRAKAVVKKAVKRGRVTYNVQLHSVASKAKANMFIAQLRRDYRIKDAYISKDS